MSKSVLAIILARGGSKGIFKKNLTIAYGKPLIQWTIDAAKQSPSISKTIVSSDDKDILELAKALEVETLLRPAQLALDNSSSESAIAHCLSELDKKNEYYDFIMLLQPTSPARNSKHIEESIETLLNSNATSLISAYIPEHSPFKSFTVNKAGFLTGIINNDLPFLPRQSLPAAYYPNGAIYLIRSESFRLNHSLFTNECIAFLMSIDDSIDIDTLDNIHEFNKYMDYNNEND
jgi:N-acylneuraminate cytidylyltransferase